MMDDRLLDLYVLSDREHLAQIYLQELSERCGYLESQIREMMESLPTGQGQILESYMDLRNELEFQSVKIALKIAKGTE